MANKHNIENYFKKKLESQEFAYQEADWQSLEQRLDAEGLSSSRPSLLIRTSRLAAILVIALTTAFIMGWFARDMFTSDHVSEIQQNASFQPAEEEVTNKQVFHEDAQSETSGLSVVTDTGSHEHTENIKEEKNTITQHHNKTAASQNKQVTKNDKSNKNMHDPVVAEKSNIPSQHGKTANDTAIQSQITKKKGNSGHANQNNRLAHHITPLLPEQPLIANENIDHNKPFSQTDKRNYHPKPDAPLTNRWAIGLSLASDFNSVGIPQEKTATARIGALVFYSISSRWTVSTGILYSNKKYNSQGQYYNPPSGYWSRKTNGLIPDQVSGSCRVIDIPVMVSYNVARTNHIAFTASAGISNYYMLDEYYNYEFNQDHPDIADGWQTRDNTWVPWGVANIALGMDIQTTPQSTVTFEPFLKIPFKKIGWANLDLHSMGIQIALKYQLKRP